MLHRFVCHNSFKSSTALRKPIFDIKSILSREDEMRRSILRRGTDNETDLNLLIENRPKEIALQAKRNSLIHERKLLSAKSLKLVQAGNSSEKEALLTKLRDLKKQITETESQLSEIAFASHRAAEALPNWIEPSVPQEPEEAEVHLFINGSSAEEIEALLPISKNDHKHLGTKFQLMEFAKAAQISGMSWYYLLNDGALLEQALVQYALSRARKAGYRMVVPPSIVKKEIVSACGFKPRDQNGEKQVYHIEGEPLALTGTAEIPLGALHSLEIIKEPVKYVGVSRSYRAEAGARGKDTAGLYRVHEFTKVELYHFTASECSTRELEDLRSFQTSLITELGLKAKMLNMPTTDLGAPAMKKYDCEAWMPGRGSWGELSSCSNCGDYQARRLGIRRFNSEKKLEYVHTLNGTAMAVPRVMIGIIEQFFDQESNSITIPPVLRPYMDGKERIMPIKGSKT